MRVARLHQWWRAGVWSFEFFRLFNVSFYSLMHELNSLYLVKKAVVKYYCEAPTLSRVIVPGIARVPQMVCDDSNNGSTIWSGDFNAQKPPKCKSRYYIECSLISSIILLEVYCDPPQSFNNGSYSPVQQKYLRGENVTYACTSAHLVLDGPKEAVCYEDLLTGELHWSNVGIEMKCKGICVICSMP